ncbi:MAG: hypothetical protein HYZ08_01315 [Candidatus Kerfeldbacteria bacterium]|nr:hypothetical protein [Candidatus Kerfeldbacteria bacterium]
MPYRTRTFLPLYIAVFIVVLIALGVVGFDQTRRTNNTNSTNTTQTLDVNDIEVTNLSESLDEIKVLESDLVQPNLDITVEID